MNGRRNQGYRTVHDHLCDPIQQLRIRDHADYSTHILVSGSPRTAYTHLLELALGATSPSRPDERVPYQIRSFSESVRGGANGDICAVRREIILTELVQQRIRDTGRLEQDIKLWGWWILGQYFVDRSFRVVNELWWGGTSELARRNEDCGE